MEKYILKKERKLLLHHLKSQTVSCIRPDNFFIWTREEKPNFCLSVTLSLLWSISVGLDWSISKVSRKMLEFFLYFF